MDLITMTHGAGGSLTDDLIKKYVLKYLGGSDVEVPLEALDDAAVIRDIVLKSDSHAVKPIFFPGGDIGRLAIAGTVNDIAVMGAEPKALATGFILEEGLEISDLERILQSMMLTCKEAEVSVITGDTKVVEKGALGGCVINTSGIGFRCSALERNLEVVREYRSFTKRWLLDSNLRPGDKILISGSIGEHGVAIMASRYGYDLGGKVESDVAPLNKMIKSLLEVGGIVSMKDLTRGGLANALNEWSEKSGINILVHEEDIPIRKDVKAACEMLGIDPLQVGNEGKIIIGVVPEMADEVLRELRRHRKGRDAQVIGEVTGKGRMVILDTLVGGRRILSRPVGDPIPRIC